MEGTMTRRSWLLVVLAAALAGASASGTEGGTPAEPDETALVKAGTEFTFDLYARLRARDGNVFFSPYSIGNALAMTYAGARGETATQMAAALRLPMNGDRLHRAFAGINARVNGTGAGRRAELYVSNALWSEARLPLLPDFQNTVKTLYKAGLTPVDFVRAPETARRTINAWVERETRDLIKDLVPEGTVNQDTRLVLTNAI